jgi:hypothetical protein
MKSSPSAPTSGSNESLAPASAPGNSPAAVPASRSLQWAQVLVLSALFSVPALICLHTANVTDADVWWHMRTGQWILEHRALPHTDPFSSFGAGKPWAAYSWLFDLLVLQFFQRLGLAGLVAYSTGMVVAVTVVLHRLIRRLQADFSIAVLLTLAASLCLSRLYTPRSWWFTILFFALELDLLMQARKTGRMRGLLWLPLIFALWANLHIQFIDGLVLLAIALAEPLLARFWTGIQTRLRPGWLMGVSAACLLATLANPYGWSIYKVAFGLASQSGVLSKVSELEAIPFRNLADYGVLLFAMAAAAVLARARRFAFFETALLAFALLVSFRSIRDVWVMVVAASAILASGVIGDQKNRLLLRATAIPFVAVLAGGVVSLGVRSQQVDDVHLRAQLAEILPVRAVQAVKAKGLGGPLFNDYNWGGYLIWELRLPVSIDERQNVYGDAPIDRSVATWYAMPDWASDPNLRKAKLVIGPVKAPLTQLLRQDPRFELVFEDNLAAVFAARRPSP